jgi:NAD(P)H-nitrite reductase large subunit
MQSAPRNCRRPILRAAYKDKTAGPRRICRSGAIDAGAGARLTARLSSGEQLQADLIVCTTGVQPNVDFLRGSGIKFLQGVLVNASMQTNVPGIYAAGDCAEVFDSEAGRGVIASHSASGKTSCCRIPPG